MDVVVALRDDRPVLLPVDTVYGLCALAASERAATNVYRLKGRSAEQPTAVLAASIEDIMRTIPELPEATLRRLLPGPYTLVVPNPAHRLPWLAGTNPDAIGVRVPELPEPTRAVVAAVGAVLATSANDPGGPNPATLDAVPVRIRQGCAAELDLGPLPGTPSTVLDLTGARPKVLREGAVPAADALRALR
jgi:L-threonylcarbamoyladenylate synthase